MLEKADYTYKYAVIRQAGQPTHLPVICSIPGSLLRRIIKKKYVQANHFHCVLCLERSERNGYKYEEYEKLTDPNGTIYEISQSSTRASAMIETYFTKAYSILDIVCKICYEIQFKQEDFSTYRKAKSADVLWGNRKKLLVNGTSNTLFEKCELISNIEALRNELVHNGTWELSPKKYIRFENGEVQEQFMFFPDMTQGH